jgi:hypothetical protein
VATVSPWDDERSMPALQPLLVNADTQLFGCSPRNVTSRAMCKGSRLHGSHLKSEMTSSYTWTAKTEAHCWDAIVNPLLTP